MATQQALLEIDYLKINRHRHNWNLYFVVATGDPSDGTKMAVTTIGGFDQKHPIQLRRGSNNQNPFPTRRRPRRHRLDSPPKRLACRPQCTDAALVDANPHFRSNLGNCLRRRQ